MMLVQNISACSKLVFSMAIFGSLLYLHTYILAEESMITANEENIRSDVLGTSHRTENLTHNKTSTDEENSLSINQPINKPRHLLTDTIKDPSQTSFSNNPDNNASDIEANTLIQSVDKTPIFISALGSHDITTMATRDVGSLHKDINPLTDLEAPERPTGENHTTTDSKSLFDYCKRQASVNTDNAETKDSLVEVYEHLKQVPLKYRQSFSTTRKGCTHIGFSKTPLPLTALASIPGAGNTWTRHIIEMITGDLNILVLV